MPLECHNSASVGCRSPTPCAVNPIFICGSPQICDFALGHAATEPPGILAISAAPPTICRVNAELTIMSSTTIQLSILRCVLPHG